MILKLMRLKRSGGNKEESSVYDAIVTLFLTDVGTLFVIEEEEI